MKKRIGKTCSERSQRVFVAMSGGVDSSVAAFLLKKQGYDVVGVFMRCFNIDGCAERDAEDARRVAEKLKIPFYVWDFEKEYKKKVVDYMVDGYRRGLTPNPDVMCNREIKFGLFFEKSLKMGADYVATGHYVRLRQKFPISNLQFSNKSKIKKFGNLNIKNSLKIAKDLNKDQSYFLWTLTQEQLKHCLFPIGDYLKSDVRKIARKAGLPTAEKKDSQGICFLGKITLDEFLSRYLPPKKGAVLNAAGKKIGEHQGAHFYTIGQRHIGLTNRGLTQTGRGITQTVDIKPLYVTEKNVKTNTLIVAEGNSNPALYKKEIRLMNVNFIRPIANCQLPITVYARIRYRQPLSPATLELSAPAKGRSVFGRRDKKNLKTYKLVFNEPQKFVAPGQSAVFYEYKKRPSASSGQVPSAKTPSDPQQNSPELKMLGGGVII